MSLNLKFDKTGITEEEINKSSEIVREIHNELIELSKDEKEFCGWLNQPSKYLYSDEYKKIKEAADKIKQNSEYLVVIGIGGSYLGARAVIEALHSSIYHYDKSKTKILFVGNNLSSDYINDIIEIVKDKDFSINVISKSGTTTEPAISFRIFREILVNKYGIEESKNRIFVTTDKNRGALKKLADREKYQTFVVPDDIGGRFSVLTAVGLLPIEVSGINIENLLKGAVEAEKRFDDSELKYNECYKYAVIRNILYEKGKKVEILASYEPKMFYFIEWFKQLFGESEGKEKKGIFPTGVMFTTDLHSLGQYIQDGERILFETVLKIEKSKNEIRINYDSDNLDELNYLEGKTVDFVNKMACEGTIKAHVTGGVPNIELNIDEISENTIGELIYFFEKACAMSAKLLEVNPFNQPGVEEYKKNMFELLGK